MACGAFLGAGGDIRVVLADGVDVVGINAACGTEREHQVVVEEVLADHHIGEETEDGAFGVRSIGVPSCGESGMEVEAVEHEVGIGVDFDNVAATLNGVSGDGGRVAEGHLAVGMERLDIAIPFGVDVGHTLVAVAEVEAVVDVAAEVEVELVLVPRGPEVGDTDVEAVAQLVGVELHVTEADIPGEEVVFGADVGEGEVVAAHAEGGLEGVVGEAIV